MTKNSRGENKTEIMTKKSKGEKCNDRNNNNNNYNNNNNNNNDNNNVSSSNNDNNRNNDNDIFINYKNSQSEEQLY